MNVFIFVVFVGEVNKLYTENLSENILSQYCITFEVMCLISSMCIMCVCCRNCVEMNVLNAGCSCRAMNVRHIVSS